MAAVSTLNFIQTTLSQALAPTILEIQDESHKHIGHGGYNKSGSHFAITIAAPVFEGKTLLECHRLIYDTLGDAVGKTIHALSITIRH